jgi:hypothetical protein
MRLVAAVALVSAGLSARASAQVPVPPAAPAPTQQAAPAPVPSQQPGRQLSLELRNGLVTLTARDVSVREILAEWAKVGRTKVEVVNGGQVPGGPITLQMAGVPERQALDTILRSVSGYMAAPRPQVIPDASVYDRIMVMATARTALATPSASPMAPGSRQQPVRGGVNPMGGPGFGNRPMPDDGDDPMSVGQGMQNPGMVGQGGQPMQQFAPYPGMTPQPTQYIYSPNTAPTTAQPAGGSSIWSTPAGTAVPGMVVPAPPNPNAPTQVNPNVPVPARPIRPPGTGEGGER